MNAWHDISTAPKDGSVVHVKRLHGKDIVYEGPAAWRTVHFGPLHDPISGERYAEANDATGWMRVDSEHRVPEPTHWRP